MTRTIGYGDHLVCVCFVCVYVRVCMRTYMHAWVCVYVCACVFTRKALDKWIELDSNLSATHQPEQWHKIYQRDDSQGKHPISNETYHDLPSEL